VDWQEAGTVLAIALGGLGSVGWLVERRDRKAETDIQRRRLEADLAVLEYQKFADISSDRGPSGRGENGGQFFEFTLTNMGPSYAKHVCAWLVDAEGTPCSNRTIGFSMTVNQSMTVRLYVTSEVLEDHPPAALRVGWRGVGGGYLEKASTLQFA
jgi:hypothetical protein